MDAWRDDDPVKEIHFLVKVLDLRTGSEQKAIGYVSKETRKWTDLLGRTFSDYGYYIIGWQ